MAKPIRIPGVGGPFGTHSPISEGIRNGVAPPALALRGLASTVNALLARRLKVHFCKSLPAASCYSSGTAATTWSTYLHTSPCCTQLVCRMVLAPVLEVVAVEGTPNLIWTVGGVAQPAVYHHRRDTGTVVPDMLETVDQEWTVVGDTDYQAVCSQEGTRIVSCTIWERPRNALTPGTDTCVSPLPFAEQLPIYDSHVSSLLTVPGTIWKRQASPVFAWSMDAATGVARTNATPANLHDQSVTSWAAGSPGHQWWSIHKGSLESDAVPVLCWAYAAHTAGGAGLVRFTDGTTSVDVAVGSATAGICTATGSFVGVAAAARTKVDVLLASSDGARTCSVYACGMMEYES